MKKNEEFQLVSRKAEHVKLVVDEDVGVEKAGNGFELFDIVPTAIPDINYNDISLETNFLGQEFTFPILVAGMTGGYPEAEKINSSLARICSRLSIPMGVGSQRAMIVNPEMLSTFNVKDKVPDLFLIGNLGLVQFSNGFTLNDYNIAVEMISADSMAIHFNAFQEICQPEGDIDFTNAWDNLQKICSHSKVPVIGKEVGSGIAWEELVKLEKLGCAAVDIGGSGGTSWAKIELMRHEGPNPPFTLDDPILRWGIPTSYATWEATEKSQLPVISTGGMYHGLMAAKALAMGASMVGIARPVLKALIEGGEAQAEKWLINYATTIKQVMFLMGCQNIEELKRQKFRIVPYGNAYSWLSSRGMI